MTPEQFRDCRLALRALRRAVRGLPPDDELFIGAAIGDVSHTIWAAMDHLPEFAEMVKAKRAVRNAQRQQQKVMAYRAKIGEENIVGGLTKECWYSILSNFYDKYHAARERFIERIGGEG